jgi:MFS family permease
MDSPLASSDEPFWWTFRALRSRDFRLLWVGAVISNTGSWLQNLAVPYVVYQVTESPLAVGIATSAQFLPALIGGPIGGHLADTRERRRLLLLLQSLMMVLALALWWVWAGGWRSIAAVLVVSSLMGLVWGTQMPIGQAFVNDLVPRADLVSAVSLNSLQFNVARAIGPAIAGLVIAARGPGLAFALNAGSFMVMLASLALMRTRSPSQGRGTPFLAGFTGAVRYIRTQPGIAVIIGSTIFIGLLVMPVFGFTVVFAQSIFHVGPLQLGILNACLGVGALLAVPILVRAKDRHGLRGPLSAGIVVMGVGFMTFGLTTTFAVGTIALLALGFGFLLSISSGQSAIQVIVAPQMRGRVMAVRLMVYMAATSIGALTQGWMAGHFGPRLVMAGCGISLLMLGALVYTPRGRRLLARIDDPEDLAERPVAS